MIRSLCALSLVLVGGCFGDAPEEGDGETDTEGGTEASGPTSSATSSPSTSAPTGTSAGSGSDSEPSTDTATTQPDPTEGSSEESSGETGVAPCELSGEWEIVIDEEGPSGQGAQGRGLGVDGEGRVYATGNADGHWFVRRSDDRGETWDLLEEYIGVGSSGGLTPGPVLVLEDGTIFVAGGGSEDGTSSRRIVRRSDDDGATWENVEYFQLMPGYDTFASGIVVDGDGRLFTSGHAADMESGHWVIRTSDDGGDTWSTDDDIQSPDGELCLPRDVFAFADGSVFASGHCFDVDENSTWLVRRRAGAGWSTVDEQSPFGPEFIGNGAANSGFAGERVLVTGAVLDGESSHWVVRMSDDGTNWSTLDDWDSENGNARANSIWERGDTMIAMGSEGGDLPTIVTRRSDDGGRSWERIDTFTYEAGFYGGGIEESADGDLYTSGIGLGTVGGLNHWIVRRMACE